MIKLSDIQISRLQKIIETFPKIKELALHLNEENIDWALAAGSAYYIYINDGQIIDDVDVWISGEDKEKVARILNTSWVSRSSERHQAENIETDSMDIFTNCKKLKDNIQLLDYLWTPSVTQRLRVATIEGVKYQIAAPEDICLLKMANPRNEKEVNQVNKLLGITNIKYLDERKRECGYK